MSNHEVEEKAAARKDVQRNAYQLTFNNPAEHGLDHAAIKKVLSNNFITMDYYCMSDEIATTGTPHTHLYVHFTSRVRWSTLARNFPTAHIEEAQGTARQNLDYILKRGEKYADKQETSVKGTFEEYGKLPEQEGRKPEMAKLVQYIMDGWTNAEIIMKNNDYALNIHILDKVRTSIITEKYNKTRRLNLKVVYISGATGIGKTRNILDEHGDENVYRVSDYKHPFDGYQTQPVLCFDEFRSNLPIGDMLNYLDIYPIQLPARYSNRFSCYEHCYVVSNWRLEEQYEDVQRSSPETWKAFLRRIHQVILYHADGTKEVYGSAAEYFDHLQKERDQKSNPFIQKELDV